VNKLLHRWGTLLGIALVVILWHFRTDPNSGAETLIRLQWLLWVLVAAPVAYLIYHAINPSSENDATYVKATSDPIGAGLALIARALLLGTLILAFAPQARAQGMPARASVYLPVLAEEISINWHAPALRSAFAAQVEQETCVTPTSPKCWNPRAELRTDREYGFGLGQLTVTPSFDNFKRARGLDASLSSWRWEDRYDPRRQLRTMVLMDRDDFDRLHFISDPLERLAMAFSAYNGGLGGVLADRRLCMQTAGCDPDKWFGHVERFSLKAKIALRGYGQSFFEINRRYVRAVMVERRRRYASWFGEGGG